MPSVYAVYAAPCMLPYYGSTTTNLKKRWSAHISAYRMWKAGNRDKYALFDLFDAVGIDACICEVVEELPETATKSDLLWRERWWVENNPCINTYLPVQTKEERKQYMRPYLLASMKKYIAEHRDEWNAKRRAKYAEKKLTHTPASALPSIL